MRFLACAVLLISTAVLANAAVGRSEDGDASHKRYRVFRKDDDAPKAEGRTFSSLFQSKGCGEGVTTITETEQEPTIIEGTIESYSVPVTPDEEERSFDQDGEDGDDESADDNDDDESYDLGESSDNNDDELIAYSGSSLIRRGNNNRVNGQLSARQYDYELRRQEDENKELRKRIQMLRRRNQQNLRRARRAQRQQLRRIENRRRLIAQRNRNNRRRANNRRRQRRNRLPFF